MSIRLYIAEKPSMARDLAQVLGAKRKVGIRWEGDGVWVASCIGHLVGIAPPAQHDPQWKSWHPRSLPILPEPIKWVENTKTKAHFKALRALIRDRKVSHVINACDAGREGELIFRTVYRQAEGRAPVSRFWVSSLTPSAIRAGLKNLQPGVDFDPLSAAAYCRAEADWLVGMNATRALTARASDLLSVGRVQTPTLAMIVDRHREIQDFKPEDYWLVEAQIDTREGAEWRARWLRSTQSSPSAERVASRGEAAQEGRRTRGRIDHLPLAEEICARTRGQFGVISRADHRQERTPPPQLYHLTALQQEGNRRYGYTADEVLGYAQSLYEKHKVLSYPRTDSRYLTPDIIPQLPKILKALPSPLDQPAQEILSRGLPSLGGRYVNAKKVGDHHGIIPTSKAPELSRLSVGERRIYELVGRALLAALSPAAIDAIMELEAEIAGGLWHARGRAVVDVGWRAVAPPPLKKSTDMILPYVAVGTAVRVREVDLLAKQTQPPKPFTEATLLGAMERAGSKIEEAELKRVMRGSGLGTPATRASILETLLRRAYLRRSSKTLEPTSSGILLIDAITADALRSPTLTAEWEHSLQQIAEGRLDPERFRQQVRAWVSDLTQALLDGPRIQLASPPSTRKKTKRAPKVSQGSWRSQSALEGSKKSTAAGASSTSSRARLPARLEEVTCPLCKRGEMIRGRRGWGCKRWREGCELVLWFVYDGVEIPEEEALRILHRGQSRLFHERDGQKWRLCLELKAPQRLRWEERGTTSKKSSGRKRSQGSPRGSSRSKKGEGSKPNASRWASKS